MQSPSQRRSSPSRLTAAAVVAAIALAASACGSESEPSERPNDSRFELTIGNSVPLSGKLGDFGADAKRAAGLAIDEIKATIDELELRQSVELVSVDNATDPSTATATARELVADGASCIVGPWSAPEALSVARSVAIPTGTMLISPATTIDVMSNLDDEGLINRTALPDSAQGRALADAIASDIGGTDDAVVNVVAREDAYGQGLASAFRGAWEEKGGTIGAEVSYDAGRDAHVATAERAVEGGPDAIVIFDFADSFTRLAPALAELDAYDPDRTWATDLLASTELPGQVPKGAIEGLRGTLVGTADDDPNAATFAERFSESAPESDSDTPGGAEPQPQSGLTFDAVLLCYLAAVASASDDGESIAGSLAAVSGPPGEPYGWRQLPDAVKALERGKEIDYQGASGPIDLDPRGDPTSGVYEIYEFDDGKLVLTDEIALGGPTAKR